MVDAVEDDLHHCPLAAWIVTDLVPPRRRQAIGGPPHRLARRRRYERLRRNQRTGRDRLVCVERPCRLGRKRQQPLVLNDAYQFLWCDGLRRRDRLFDPRAASLRSGERRDQRDDQQHDAARQRHQGDWQRKAHVPSEGPSAGNGDTSKHSGALAAFASRVMIGGT